ncbi:MAG: hypothetical protein WDZ69_01170 [Candidatus Pacearchaeota archaeon]
MRKNKEAFLFLGIFVLLAFAGSLIVKDISITGMATSEFLKDSDEFDQGETLIAEISGNFIDQITHDNVHFFEDHVGIPMIHDVKKIEESFFIYAQLKDKSAGNYSFVISDVRYMLGAETTDEDIVVPFKITENTADFYVSPGFITTRDDFDLEFQNLKSDRITISIEHSDLLESQNSLELISGEIEEINFQRTEKSQDSEYHFEKITLSSGDTSYEVPVLLEPFDGAVDEEQETEDPEETEEKLDFRFEPNSANVSIATESDSKRIIYLLNTGEDLIENISISVSPSLDDYVNVSPSEILMLSEGSRQKIEISIISGEDEESLEGKINALSKNLTTSFTFNLDFVIDFIPEDEEENETGTEIITTCEQLGGNICGSGESCTGETTSAKDGTCCLEPAICEEDEESNTGRIVGWSIVIVVIILLAWFFLKYKKARPKADILSRGRKR